MTDNTAQNTADSADAPGVRDVLSPANIAPDALARMLGLASDVVQRHIDQGAPVNPDGTINLVHYAAWLNASPPNPRNQEDADVGARSD